MYNPSHAFSPQPPYLRRRLPYCVMLLCVMIALTGCTTAQGGEIRSSPSLDPPKVIIITNAREVDSALQQAAGDPPRMTTSPHPVEQARQIDYTRTFAILALQGGQGTSGYSI